MQLRPVRRANEPDNLSHLDLPGTAFPKFESYRHPRLPHPRATASPLSRGASRTRCVSKDGRESARCGHPRATARGRRPASRRSAGRLRACETISDLILRSAHERRIRVVHGRVSKDGRESARCGHPSRRRAKSARLLRMRPAFLRGLLRMRSGSLRADWFHGIDPFVRRLPTGQ